ncbi:hypothetical protein OJF2_59770 [Aquisphaera giovannonii]|uniref:Uncharacterized protein n=1 Tax=Aquisphaera giovannonii TaxID=406548 RepID=A0A5B9WAB7_9BACT|nr:hypothetical protein [Aquisphaera giovannonii]QEH37387.1 hypothetical protein OJF2_59770 [Aquisphaera giovannonii]
MIIECPKCHFSGRIPSYALDTPYNARCPRCRFRFELNTLLAGAPDDALEAPGIDGLEAETGDGPAGDPGASSYELKAIAEEFDAGPSVAEDLDWRGDGHSADLAGVAASSGAPIDDRGDPTVAASGFLGPRWSASDPWYSRVLQAWGVAFLIWAALILGRSLQWMFAADGDASGPGHLVATVCCVVLLVPGSAALFLLVDLSRYLRRRTLAPEPSEDARRPPVFDGRLSGPMGLWGRASRIANGTRPQV